MVLAAEAETDLGEAGSGELAGEKHRDHARAGDALVATWPFEVGDADGEVGSDGFLYGLDRDGSPSTLLGRLTDHLADEPGGDRNAFEVGEGRDPNEGAFELADVALDLLRQIHADVVGDGDAVVLRLLTKNGDARLEVGPS